MAMVEKQDVPRILFVDDDHAFFVMMTCALKFKRCEVVPAPRSRNVVQL
jgi:hypothetical protein